MAHEGQVPGPDRRAVRTGSVGVRETVAMPLPSRSPAVVTRSRRDDQDAVCVRHGPAIGATATCSDCGGLHVGLKEPKDERWIRWGANAPWSRARWLIANEDWSPR